MINAKSEVRFPVGSAFAVFAPGLAGSVLIGSESVFGTEVARADAIRSAKEARHLFRSHLRNHSAIFVRFERFAQRRANIAGQWIVSGHPFIGAFEDNN